MSNTYTTRAPQVKPSLDWARRWMPVILWVFVISWFSTSTFSGQTTTKYLDPIIFWFLPEIETARLGLVHFVIRKSAHVTEYCILSILMIRALRPPLLASWSRAALTTLATCAAYALVDELHQYLVPGRIASLKDVALDFCGAATGVIVFLAFALPRGRELRKPGRELRAAAENDPSESG